MELTLLTWHRNAIAEVPEIEIAACVDVDAARARKAADETGAPPFTSLDDALESGAVQAVDLMLPHDRHEEVAIHCLESGVHVLLEKPMAPTVDACERILAAAGRASSVFMVAENAQYWPEVLIANELIEDGAIGDLVTAQVHLFMPPMPMYYGGADPWRFDQKRMGGGVSIDTGSHYIRPLRMWLGEIDEVVAAMEHPYEPMQGESLARALFRFVSGQVVSFDLMLTEAAVGPQEIFRITGSTGEILIGSRVRLVNAASRKPVPVREDVPQGYMHSYAGQFRDFASAVRIRM